jgi:uncharacterized tellurite resistance protein B-like protein
MLREILKRLFSRGGELKPTSLNVTKDGAPVSQDLQLAVIVLLIEMSGKDQHIADEEAEVVVEVGIKYFGLGEEESIAVVEQALQARKDAGKIDGFVKRLNDAYSERQKQTLMAIMWKIVLADGQIDIFERKFAVQVRYRLQLDETLSEDAKRMAIEGLV